MQIPGAEELTVYLEKENKTLGEYALGRKSGSRWIRPLP